MHETIILTWSARERLYGVQITFATNFMISTRIFFLINIYAREAKKLIWRLTNQHFIKIIFMTVI